MRLYSAVDLTGNVKMIAKLVLGETGTWILQILSLARIRIASLTFRLENIATITVVIVHCAAMLYTR